MFVGFEAYGVITPAGLTPNYTASLIFPRWQDNFLMRLVPYSGQDHLVISTRQGSYLDSTI